MDLVCQRSECNKLIPLNRTCASSSNLERPLHCSLSPVPYCQSAAQEPKDDYSCTSFFLLHSYLNRQETCQDHAKCREKTHTNGQCEQMLTESSLEDQDKLI